MTPATVGKKLTQNGGSLSLRFQNLESESSGSVRIEYDGSATEWLVGRDPDCYLVLDDPKVSRRHAKICILDGEFYFFDLGSKWGVIINNEPLSSGKFQQLAGGDRILLGDTSIRIDDVILPGESSVSATTSLPATSRIEQKTIGQQVWGDGQDIDVICYRVSSESPDTKTFCFTGEKQTLFYFFPGQFVNIEVVIDGRVVRRPYSISSSPSRPYTLSITVKRVPAPEGSDVPPGLVSNWLHDHFREGDRLRLVGAPMGDFTFLPNVPSKLLLIGAGSGITPLMSMLRWFYDTPTQSDIILVQSAKDPSNILFQDEIKLIGRQVNGASHRQRFRSITTLTRPEGHSWDGMTGRISPEMLQILVPDLLDRAVFCCGPNEFMDGVKAFLQEMRFPMQNYKQESFGGKKPKAAAAKEHLNTSNTPGNIISATQISEPKESSAKVEAAEVVFASSGKRVPIDPDGTLLELAESCGVEIKSACRAGVCGACRVKIKGQVRYDEEPSALSDSDRKQGLALACVAYPVSAVSVEV